MSFFENHYKKINITPPLCHFVLGSGFSLSLDKIKDLDFFKNWEERKACSFSNVPQIPSPTVKSHAGLYRFFVHKKSNQAISFQCGRLHLYEGHSAQTVAEPVLQVLLAGTKRFVLNNISGGLKKEHTVGTVIALTDHVNFTGTSPLIGPEKTTPKGKKIGHRFPDMSRVYDTETREKISAELLKLKIRVSPGIYAGLCGPELETPAQIEWLNRSSKGLFDAVGMSTVLEAIALKQAGAKLAGFSLIANPACGIDPKYPELSFSQMIASIEKPILKILQAYFHYSENCLLYTDRV